MQVHDHGELLHLLLQPRELLLTDEEQIAARAARALEASVVMGDSKASRASLALIV